MTICFQLTEKEVQKLIAETFGVSVKNVSIDTASAPLGAEIYVNECEWSLDGAEIVVKSPNGHDIMTIGQKVKA